MPRHIMRVITRRATMLAGDRSQGVVEAYVRRSCGKAQCVLCIVIHNITLLSTVV